MTPTESSIAAGTVLLRPSQIAPRLGCSVRKVIARARTGALPCHRPNSRTYLFHWPTVVAALFKH